MIVTRRNTSKLSFQEGALIDRVYHTYLLMHTNQTVEFVRKKNEQYAGCNLCQMTIMEALEMLDNVVDESDPDVDFPNSYHAYQTAEGIREKHPEKDWFHLVGLLHDLGKILALSGEPQWAVVGDTFPVGCKLEDSIVFRDSTFHDNPDTRNPLYTGLSISGGRTYLLRCPWRFSVIHQVMVVTKVLFQGAAGLSGFSLKAFHFSFKKLLYLWLDGCRMVKQTKHPDRNCDDPRGHGTKATQSNKQEESLYYLQLCPQSPGYLRLEKNSPRNSL
uniref:Inositol oxygenase n=1 Tax=Naja naja TaxID=35670 RepID=A0A8C6YDG8_NAJNA